MCRPLPPTKILHCPQCIKAKINSSIKGRSYVKHLNCFFEISFTPANVSSKKQKKKKKTKQNKKTKTKGKRQKEKGNKKKRKLKQIWHYFKSLNESLICIPIGGDLK